MTFGERNVVIFLVMWVVVMALLLYMLFGKKDSSA